MALKDCDYNIWYWSRSDHFLGESVTVTMIYVWKHVYSVHACDWYVIRLMAPYKHTHDLFPLCPSSLQLREPWTPWTLTWSKESQSESCGPKETPPSGSLEWATCSSRTLTSPLTTKPCTTLSLLLATSSPARYNCHKCDGGDFKTWI